ncbi:MAG: PTS sugar transporter subunit IIA [Pseudomonadota bacterium]
MIGIVIVAHGGLAQALLSATEHVVGPLEAARAVAVEPSDDLVALQRVVDAAAAEVDRGAGVAVVTDMFGGSPSNLAMRTLANGETEVIYGANLPLLVKLAKCRRRPLAEATACALEAGRKYLDSAGQILAARRASA